MRTTLDQPGSSPERWLMLIGGDWVPGTRGEWADVVAPSRPGVVLATVPEGTAEDVDVAVGRAAEAFPAWRALHFRERQQALLAIAADLAAEAEDFAVLTAQDTGNALRTQARPESATLVDLFRYFGGVAGEFKGAVLPSGNGQLQYTRREPLGVVGAILPWNSPLMIAGMKIPAALAAGNTMVVKPAEDAPLTILKLAEMCNRHLPPGVLNVVTGLGSTVGAAITAHPGIAKVSFTGSTAVGRSVAADAGRRLVPVSLELGGKSPNIVFPSAATPQRLAETVEGTLLAMRFTRQGQSCTAGSRLLVHSDVYDEFLAALHDRVAQLVVGDPLDEASDMGSIINQKQYDTIRGYVDEGLAQTGARAILDGREVRPSGPAGSEGGYYMGPSIIADVDPSWRIAREEIFGPVLVATPWTDRADAVRIANSTSYGLAAYVWSHDLDEAILTAHEIESGWVQVNQGGGQVIGQAYGGYKDSGMGREFSLEGALESMTQTKQVNIKLS
jgi:aldehyde dehydrogenase (NAD+)